MGFGVQYVIMLIFFSVLKAMILADVSANGIEFPEFNDPQYEFVDVNDMNFYSVGGINAVSEALHNIGEILEFVGRNTIALLETILNGVVFIAEWALFIVTNSITPIEGAPAFVNVLLVTPITAAVGVMVFSMTTGRKVDA